jgi:hypothetical protein
VRKYFALVAVLALSASLSAQTAGQSGAPAPKADAKAATGIAGKWNVSVDVNGNAMLSVLDVKLDGKKLTGTLTGDNGAMPVEGEFADNKLTLSFSFNSPNGAVGVTFTATLKDDVLTGTADAGQAGSFPLKAERVKEK